MTFEVSMTVPDKLFDLSAFTKAIVDGMNHTLDSSATSFKVIFDTWSAESKPTLVVERPKKRDDTIEGSVKVIGEIFAMVNNGTGIRPRTAKTSRGMRFRRSYRRKTVPGRIVSGSSARLGGWVNKRRVNSGAIKPGDFDATIAEQERPGFYKVISDATDIALKTKP